MRILVFNSKGGCGKSLVTREIIAAPKAKNFVIAEVDELNRTQAPYADRFKDVLQLSKKTVKELLIHLNDHDNIVIDVGADNLSAALQVLVEYNLFDDIDKVVIPLGPGRTDCENALKTYQAIIEHCNNIVFAFNRVDPDLPLEDQFPVFFNNALRMIPELSDDMKVIVTESDIFLDAQNEKKLVTELAENIDYKSAALTAKADGDANKFRELMQQELNKRAAQILLEKTILPAHHKIMMK
jgi:MinD-like ATPase involved in chromosome partitioning or flagellar assembly